jgi:hypothetical protein
VRIKGGYQNAISGYFEKNLTVRTVRRRPFIVDIMQYGDSVPRRLDGDKTKASKGFSVPLKAFLFGEVIQWLQRTSNVS